MQRILRKLYCLEEGCGFVGDLLENGLAYDDISCEKPVALFRHKDDKFECPACGAMIL